MGGKMKKMLLAFLTVMLVLGMSVPVFAASPKLSATRVYLRVGQTKTITLNNLTTSQKKKITFKSSNSSVAAVSSTGKITARSAGTATITARYQNKSYKCAVRVNRNWSKYNGTYRKDLNTSIKGVMYTVVFKQYSNGRIKMQAEYLGPNGSPLYDTNQFWVNLNSSGRGKFQWHDTWGNKGTGVVVLKNGKIIVNLTQTYTASYNRSTVARKLTLSRTTTKTLFASYTG